jgi:tetratricopeptide (TPR) repeat protein
MHLGLIAALLFAVPIQIPADEPIARMSDWMVAVERHKPGTADAPARVIGAWPRADLRDFQADLTFFLGVVEAVNGLPPRKRPMLQPSRPRPRPVVSAIRGFARELAQRRDWDLFLKRAALLHADIAMLVPLERSSVQTPSPQADPPSPQADPLRRRRASSSGRIIVETEDGVALDLEYGTLHWDIARTTLESAARDPARDETVQAWYRATTAYLENEEQFAYTVPHLNAGLRLLPGDARLLFYAGALHEAFASPSVQAASRALESRPNLKSEVGSVEAELELAERFFRQTLAADPRFAEARLRLGRVLGLLGRHEEAANELRRSIPQLGDTQLVYYAELFLGHEEAALRRRDAAREHFARAATLYPRAQSPRLALGLLARAYGDRPGAVRSVKEVLALPPHEDEREDPWWEYHKAHVRNTDALLDELRRPFLKGSKP